MGTYIRSIRKAAGYTQEALGEALGVTPEYISRIENDRAKPSWRFLVGLANLLHVPIQEVLSEIGLLGEHVPEAEVAAFIAVHPELAEVFEYAQRHPDIIPDLLRFARFLISEREREKSSRGTLGAD